MSSWKQSQVSDKSGISQLLGLTFAGRQLKPTNLDPQTWLGLVLFQETGILHVSFIFKFVGHFPELLCLISYPISDLGCWDVPEA